MKWTPERIETRNAAIDAEIRRLRLRQPCPEKMRFLLDDLTRSFSQMALPDQSQFRYWSELEVNDISVSSMLKPIKPKKQKTTFISRGDGVIFDDSHLKDIESIFSHSGEDAILWLIPQILKIVQDNWDDIVSKAPTEAKYDKPYRRGCYWEDAFDTMRFWGKWAHESGISSLMASVDRIARCFCDLSRDDSYNKDYAATDPFWEHEYRARKAEAFKNYMTPDMRRTLKSYIVAWYETFGRKKMVVFNGYRFDRIWAHNFMI